MCNAASHRQPIDAFAAAAALSCVFRPIVTAHSAGT